MTDDTDPAVDSSPLVKLYERNFDAYGIHEVTAGRETVELLVYS